MDERILQQKQYDRTLEWNNAGYDGDATISVYISGSGEEKYCYLKITDVWQRCSAVYKKVNGSWVLQSNLATVFDSGTNYKLN